MKRYRDLTPEEKAEHTNGCGAKGGWFNPPDFIFTEDCNRHDWLYTLGGSEEDRKLADQILLDDMLLAAASTSWWGRWRYRILAHIYYRAIRLFGAKYFNYAEPLQTETQEEA
jgi:hypothetical protein